MSEKVSQLFKDWMVVTGKSKNTVSNYLTGVNTVSNHCGRDVLAIDDLDELERLYGLYGPQGVLAAIGSSNSGNVQSGLKQWLGFQRRLQGYEAVSIDPVEGRKQWQAFLDFWPVEKLRALTLEQYYGEEGDDSFYSWLRDHTGGLGYFKEGILSAGVRLRVGNTSTESATGMQTDGRHIWYSMLGNSAQEAFEHLKVELLTTVEAVQQGDLSLMADLKDAPGALLWKVAFLYQDQAHPQVLPFYTPRWLQWIAGSGASGGTLALQQRLIREREGRDLLEFAAELERRAMKGASTASEKEPSTMSKSDIPLNQILFGPPGTGKTYATIDAALEVLDPDYFLAQRDNREALKQRFDELVLQDRIRFVTFHQSFSYEDFVQGLKAESVAGQINYVVKDGVFKSLCDRARVASSGLRGFFIEALEELRSLVGETGSAGVDISDYLGFSGRIVVDGDLIFVVSDFGEKEVGEEDLFQVYLGGKPFSREVGGRFSTPSIEGMISAVCKYIKLNSNSLVALLKPDDVFKVPAKGDVRVRAEKYSGKCYVDRADFRRWLNANGIDVKEMKDALQSSGVLLSLDSKIVMARGTGLKSSQNWCWVFDLNETSIGRAVWGDDFRPYASYLKMLSAVVHFMISKFGLQGAGDVGSFRSRSPYVLIVDEINRGNVSRIFGELISLIEPSKREGAEEALAISLPYSAAGDLFSVPDNLYLIGTMNTADRSLAGLDIALRRRFVFREMPPRPELLDNVEVEGLSVGKLLRVMNQRIEVLLDRDHCLGHAYFMPLKGERTLARLEAIFRNQILPLLQEYFFEDWERISWVLNDQQAAAKGSEPFIRRPHVEGGLAALFGSQVAEKLNDQRWELNDAAFGSLASYQNILG